MALVAHKYMPEEMPDEELRATFAAREHTLEYLKKSLTDQCDSTTLTSYLITGPRGAGKTTIVLMLCLRIRDDARLSAAWLPVRFPEELPGVTSLRDLLAEALHVLAEDGVADAAELYKQVEAEVDDDQSLELAVSGLRQIADRQGRRLVLFVENLDLVFDRGLDERTRATLRRLLMDAPFMMIVGTAVHPLQELAAYDEPFFNYFCPVSLDRLDDDGVRQILFQRAKFDGNERFSEQYQRHQARIKAISRLTGGNPRLVLMLYEAIAHGNLASTVDTLRALVDELTPLLKHVLEHQFSDQQSKVLDALMRCGATATPTQVAEAARLRLNTVTTQLSRLKEMQIVEVRGGGKGRAAYYTVPDQLFSTWYQMRYLRRHRRRIELFVDVLRLWFEEEERLQMMRELAEEARQKKGKPARDAATATEYFAASLAQTAHHPQAREMAVRTWLQIGEFAQAAFALAEDADIQADDRQGYEAAAFASLGRWSSDRDDRDTEIQALRMALGRDPDNLKRRLELGLALASSDEYSAAHEQFDRVVSDPASDAWLHVLGLLGRGVARAEEGDADGAIGDFTAIVEFEGVTVGLAAEALINRGMARAMLGDTDGAIGDYTSVVELDDVPVDELANALFKRGIRRFAQGDADGTIDDFTAVVELKGAPPEKIADALFGRGAARGTRGETVLCLDDCLAAAARPEACERTRTHALGMAYRVACSDQNEALLDRASLAAVKAFGRLERAERFEQMEAVLLLSAQPEMKSAWPRVMKSLAEGQPPEVVERLEFFRPVAEILETGDLSKLDPLPPEQREFVREVLHKFEAPEAETA